MKVTPARQFERELVGYGDDLFLCLLISSRDS
jgi:hypothetical protein